MDTFKEYITSVLVGTGVLFVLFGLATSIHYSLILFGVGVGIGSIIYLLLCGFLSKPYNLPIWHI